MKSIYMAHGSVQFHQPNGSLQILACAELLASHSRAEAIGILTQRLRAEYEDKPSLSLHIYAVDVSTKIEEVLASIEEKK